jgi:hypothetical protein
MATATRTRTTTHTKTFEERAVLAAIEVRRNNRPGRWEMDDIKEFVHGNHTATHEAHEQGRNDDPLVDVEDWLIPVIVGQLIERGLVYRCGTDPEAYTRAS